jgi:hypothetical protein
MLLQHLGHDRGIDAGDRNVGTDAIDDQRAEGEPDALLELGCLGEDAEIEVCRKLFGSGGHGTSLVNRTLLSDRGGAKARFRT